jgi:hypothetical protein
MECMEVRWEPVTRPVVAFVAVHVHLQTALGGDFAQGFYRGCALGHGSFKMGNAAHDVYAQVQGPLQVGGIGAVAIIAVLGKSHQLQINIGFDLIAQF